MDAKKIGLENTGKCVGVNVDVNPCVEPRHVLHERPIFHIFHHAGGLSLCLD